MNKMYNKFGGIILSMTLALPFFLSAKDARAQEAKESQEQEARDSKELKEPKENKDLLRAQEVRRQERTVYAVKGEDTLWFETYRPTGKPNGISVLFVHGGAFTGGDPVNQYPMGEGLAKLGYRVFVIKYRLYLKGKSFGCTTETSEKLKAIRYGVEDAIDATKYLVAHAAELRVDTSKLFLSGSSAGAEAILNTVFNPFAGKQYQGFRYAGALSFAGAVIDMNTVTSSTWVPLLLMHGTRDQLVPFTTAAHRFCRATDAGWLMLSGSHTLYEQAVAKHYPLILYTYEGRGHEVSNFMFSRFREMDEFMQAVVSGKDIGQREIVAGASAEGGRN